MARTVNQAGLDLIKSFEGCELTAYQDVAGIWTIGYGHIAGVTEGLVWSQEQADAALVADVAGTAAFVAHVTGAPVTSDDAFAAMVSLAYNIGVGAFSSSSVLRFHRAGAYAQAADSFLLWDKVTIDGALQVVDGLERRRAAERTLYLTGAS